MGAQPEGDPSGDGRAYGGPVDGDSRYQADREMEDTHQAHQQRFLGEGRGTGSPAMNNNHGKEREVDTPRVSGERERTRPHGARKGSGQIRLCKKCGEPLTGQFVRALGGTFHLDCFKCKDCGQIVASKFFPVDDENGEGQFPLCETDYFRRLDLLCHLCGGALRGSYITALDRKYHIDHFTCSVCPTVFGAQDSYYEHDGQVYCHYHYSTQFAQRCFGCHTAILKQFVEIFRNGQDQHWHPECYMINKFWSVRLAATNDPNDGRPSLAEDDEQGRLAVRKEEERMEEKVYRIWSVLSTFEESSAACISDMLLHVSNGAYVDGVLVAKKFIWHVDILFHSADGLDAVMMSQGLKGLSYSREAKLLCKKVVAFFSLLSKTHTATAKKLGVTQELLSLVTGLAHYLKLLIRICLQGALRVERETQNSNGLKQFLDDLGDMDSTRDDEKSLETATGMAVLADLTSDQCSVCHRPIEDECARCGDRRWHLQCLTCCNCGRELGQNLEDARWSEKEQKLYCNSCEGRSFGAVNGFIHVTRLQQYVFLLKVALARLLSMLRSSGLLPEPSNDPDSNGYGPGEGNNSSRQPDDSSGTFDSRSRTLVGSTDDGRRESSYENTLNDVRRLRSTRMDKHLSSTIRRARHSRILDGVEGQSARPGSAGADGSDMRSIPPHIVEERDAYEAQSDHLFNHQDALTLDDIPRIVAAEQAKEQRPNAHKYRHDPFKSSVNEPKLVNGHQRFSSNQNEMDSASAPGAASPPRPSGKKYFSELSALEYFIVRHVAVLSMHPLLEGHFTMEELLGLIESRKPTFWNKIGKAFKNDGSKGSKKKGVFGVPLESILERDFVDSTDAIGPGTLRIPSIIDDCITTMRQMDLSVEGVFRKNGNIKRLNETLATIDKDGCGAVDLSKENVVQVAALLKKYLRDLPDPLLTFKLHRLFIASQRISDEETRRRVLHLTCCLLPKSHRDCLEVLFVFLNWVASFHQVDEESGSKMDTHNLATVIAPNILFNNSKNVAMDDSFLAIEAVHALIEFNEQMCEVPEDLQAILNDSSQFNNDSQVTTKEILKRYGDIGTNGSTRRQVETHESPMSNSNQGSSRALAPVVTRVDSNHHQANAWQKESSVRHVQDQAAPYAANSSNQNTPPQQWQGEELGQPSPYSQRTGTPDSQVENGRRDWRQSGWGRQQQQQQQNGSLGVTGAI